jgi:hypothetical protein
MDASQTGFPAAWWGNELPSLRPRVSTYGRYEYEDLVPPSSVRLDGTFDWLRAEVARESSIRKDDRCDVRGCFGRLSHFCSEHSIILPHAFVAFFHEIELAERIRSCTLCFLDLATDVIPAPKGDGQMVRFLSDQQGCVFWYLFLTPGQEDHCVVASPDYFGSDAAEVWPEPSDPDSIDFCAPSFESFLFRFWLENEYWFASHGHGGLSPAAQEYMSAYGWTPAAPAPAVAEEPRRGWLRRLLGR